MLFQKPNYDWLIAGLGNPGPEYEKTRHNTGFMSLDLLAARLQVKVSKEHFKALTGASGLRRPAAASHEATDLYERLRYCDRGCRALL